MTGIFTASLSDGDPLPARLSAVALLAGAGVEGDGGESAFFGHLRELDVDDFLVVPSGAKLDGEGNLHGGADGLEDVADERQIAQQAGASVAGDDLAGGAAEVEIDEVEAHILDDLRGFRERGRIAAEELRRDGMLVAVEREVALGLLVLVADDAVGRGELGHHESAAAEIADEAAEDGVGDSGHGCEHRCGTDFDSAERDRCGDAGVGRRGALGRVVEKLGHDTILAGLGKNDIHHGGTEDTEKIRQKQKAAADFHGSARITLGGKTTTDAHGRHG